MSLTLEELKEAVLDRLDADDLIDILDISAEELLEAFTDRLEEKREKFDYIEEEVFYPNEDEE